MRLTIINLYPTFKRLPFGHLLIQIPSHRLCKEYNNVAVTSSARRCDSLLWVFFAWALLLWYSSYCHFLFYNHLGEEVRDS